MDNRNEVQGTGKPSEAATEMTTKDKVQYSMLGIVLIGGVLLIGRHLVKNGIANSEQRRSLTDGSSSTYAKQIKMAFQNDGWPGTDKDALRQAVRDISSKSEFRRVMTSYRKMYNSSLLADMQQELKSSEYNEMLYIVSAKPESAASKESAGISNEQLEAWARRLRAAFDISYGPVPGTDEPAIKAVFLEIPTQVIYSQVGSRYKMLYGNDLTTDLKSELEFWEYEPMMQLIYSKPKS